MGYAISWLAVKQEVAMRLLEAFGLQPTGETAEYGERLFTGRTLSTGWFLLFINQANHDYVSAQTLESLTELGDVVMCSVEEHVMVSNAEGWRDGTEMWRLAHDAERGLGHLLVEGTPPKAYKEIEARLRAQLEEDGGEDADVETDYLFDIPVETAQSVVGFKHHAPGGEDTCFTVYARGSADGKKPWWKVW